MVNSQKIVAGVNEAHGHTSESSDSASESISRAIRCLADAAGMDEQAGGLYEQLIEIDSLLNDFNRELSAYSKSLDFSEEEFAQTEERLNEINRLKIKYGNSIEEIQTYCKEKEERLKVLNDYDCYLEQLRSSSKKRKMNWISRQRS